MALRSPQARLRLAAVGMTAALVWAAGARADVLHAIYRVSLIDRKSTRLNSSHRR